MSESLNENQERSLKCSSNIEEKKALHPCELCFK